MRQELPASQTVTYQTLDGKIIKAPEKPDDLTYDAVLSATPFSDGTAFLIYPEVYNTYTTDGGFRFHLTASAGATFRATVRLRNSSMMRGSFTEEKQ
jgi:hypothetical protein